ncbi:MAG: DNA translocase FtsK, partial [Eubacterium sp.]|nr:DNA translocase FtsK [Eubacterium sp.]
KQGPSITRYEIQPEVGVKVASIKNLENDIALNLKAKSIRIEAPIPGKAAVGIEVNNDKSHIVRISEVIGSDDFRNAKSKITFAIGKDIAGKPIIADLNKMPHLLIAGTTGSGKSVCMNCIITSFLYKADPDEVKLILIDPKKVEFGNYKDIPHLLTPVVQDEAKAAAALSWAVVEMTNRYKAFAELGVRNIQGYNALMRENGESDLVMPQIVIIIDELADLMIAAKKQVEESIVRLAQLARAAGMHLIVATQRPTVNVITGLIKANIPSRIAFKVPTFVDSKTIIDMAGAEKLLGDGDMLFYPLGANKPYRVQGAFIDDSEVNGLIEYVKAQGKAEYSEEATSKIEKGQNGESMEMDESADEFLKDAIEFVIEKEKASTSMLQRQFRIGYNRAANLIDEMEKRGIVGPPDGARPRQVLMTMDEYKGITKTVDLPNLDDIAYQEEYDDDSVVTKEDIFPEAVETETEPDVPAVPDAGPDTSYGDLSKRVIPMGTSQFSSILDHRDTMSFGYDYEGTSAADDFLGLRDEDE